MIKFKYLIHKETGTVIKYEKWLENATNNLCEFSESKTKELIFSDDYEIIYDSEFTYRELRNIYLGMNDKEICNKAKALMDNEEKYSSETVEKELDEIYKKRKNIEGGGKHD